MVRLVFAVGLLLGGCKFDGGGIPRDADPEFPDADPNCVPTGDEQCNDVDDDCDGPVDEDFPTLGDDCDGADDDECLEGTFGCNEAGDDVACSDATDSTTEVCDGAAVDEDCDGMSDEDFDVGMPCDGPDMDMCDDEGGLWQCGVGGAAECTDASGDTPEVCDGLGGDEDCDGQPDEGFVFASDELNCGGCNIICLNGAPFFTSSNECTGGTCMPVCTAGARDCDAVPANGCENRNTNPLCAAPEDIGSIRGDGTGSPTASRSDYGEAWYELTVTETVAGGSGGDIRAQISLVPPAGVDFDLFVYCPTCIGSDFDNSTNGAGVADVVELRHTDDGGDTDSYTVLIEVRYVSQSACGNWTLTITGNAGALASNNIDDTCEI